MPYIKPEDRSRLDGIIRTGVSQIRNPGDLNYFISKMLHTLVFEKGLSYNYLNEMVGVLECVKLELYRTVASPYEDKKRRDHGPVSELDTIGPGQDKW